MYRGRLWTMRQYAGFGDGAESNARYRYLLSQGVNGLSVAFDLPTQMGYDSDHALAAGEVGRVGVAIDSIEDMAELLDGIPLDRVTTSMTINSTAIILLALYAAVARAARRRAVGAGRHHPERHPQGVPRARHLHLPARAPSLRIVTDIFAFCERELPQWNTISISGYHIREAGSTAAQEIAFTFANAIAYVQAGRRRRARRQPSGTAPVVLLQLPQQLPRGDRQVSRGAAAVGAHHARPFRRDQPARAAAAFPHPDGRQHAHRPATRQQHRPGGAAGDGGGAGRDAVAALQRPRRSAVVAHRGGGQDCAAHAAGHRRRDRSRQHGRPGRRRRTPSRP